MNHDVPSPVQVGGLIPHFFFDIYGRILPGAYLIAGGFLLYGDFTAIDLAKSCAEKFPYLGPAIGFIAFAAGSFIVGLLVGAVSHFFVELPWESYSPWNLGRVQQALGGSDKTMSHLSELLRKQFGLGFGQEGTSKAVSEPPDQNAIRWILQGTREVLKQGLEKSGIIRRLYRRVIPGKEFREEHAKLVQVSRLCAYHVWATSQNLGVLTSRWDAEALSSRSFLMASVGLALWSLCDHEWLLFVIFCLFTLGAFLSYHHYRWKQVFGRFQLLLALARKD